VDKFGRNYQLTIDAIDNEQITIELPFSLEFDVTRNILSSANTSSIKIYNLADDTRRKIYKDKFSFDVYRGIQLKAGYGENIPTIFKGNVKQCWSARQGVNYITTAEAFDGGFAYVNGQSQLNIPEGTPKNAILDEIIKSMPNVQKGVIGGEFNQKTTRANTITGNSADALAQVSGGAFFTDLERVYCLADNEAIQGSIDVITSDSGLLGTPIREETTLTFDILFEPRLMIGQLVELQSQTERNFNGLYKVISIQHRGMISPTTAGTAVTSVGLWFGPERLKKVN